MGRYRLIDLMCPNCYFHEERLHDQNDGELILKCPNCEETDMEKVWLKAPMSRIGGEYSERSINAMKGSFKKRFVKKELDDVRDRFGKLYDDSIRSAAASKIKEEIKNDT